jgi:putative oxidoreductase
MTQLLDRPQEAVTHDRGSETIRAERRVRPTNVNKGLLLVRVVVGALFVGHGCQKLFGLFGGDGMQAWTATVARAGIQPAATWATLAATAELGSGVLLILGLLTPLASALLIGDMLVAILKVHASKGLWSQQGGFEYNLVLIALLLAIGIVGPGMFSLDRRLPFALPRPVTFIVLMVLTLIGVAIAVVPTLGASSG